MSFAEESLQLADSSADSYARSAPDPVQRDRHEVWLLRVGLLVCVIGLVSALAFGGGACSAQYDPAAAQ